MSPQEKPKYIYGGGQGALPVPEEEGTWLRADAKHLVEMRLSRSLLVVSLPLLGYFIFSVNHNRMP